ncbi:MAG: STAS domain-containing protein [Acidobacteria bacterium]|nr:STAS domain-containing protein [Acidobacteriota bacterium]
MPLTYTIDAQSNGILVALCGNLTLGPQLAKFTKELHQILAASQPKGLILDLSEISEIDSSGLGELVILYTTSGHQGSRLCLLKPSERVFRVIQATHLTEILPQFADLLEASRWIDSVQQSGH